MTTNNDEICDVETPDTGISIWQDQPQIIQQNGYPYVSIDSTMKKGNCSHRIIAISKTIHIGLDAGIAR